MYIHFIDVKHKYRLGQPVERHKPQARGPDTSLSAPFRPQSVSNRYKSTSLLLILQNLDAHMLKSISCTSRVVGVAWETVTKSRQPSPVHRHFESHFCMFHIHSNVLHLFLLLNFAPISLLLVVFSDRKQFSTSFPYCSSAINLYFARPEVTEHSKMSFSKYTCL